MQYVNVLRKQPISSFLVCTEETLQVDNDKVDPSTWLGNSMQEKGALIGLLLLGRKAVVEGDETDRHD